MFCKAQHRRGEVDTYDLVTVRRERHRHATGAAPDIEDRSASLTGQAAVEVDVARDRAPAMMLAARAS